MSENSPLQKKEKKEGTSELQKTSQSTSGNPSTSQQFSAEFEQKIRITDQQKEGDNFRTPASSKQRMQAMTKAPSPRRKTREEASTSRRREQKPPSCRRLPFNSVSTPTFPRDTNPAIAPDTPPQPPQKKTREKPSNSRRQAPPPERRQIQLGSSSTGDRNAEKQKSKRIREDDGTE